MSAVKTQRCLVLNKGWTPVGTVSLQRAITMLFGENDSGSPKAKIVDPGQDFQTFTWEDWSKLRPHATDEAIQGANIMFRIPEVILLTSYDKIPKPKIHFSRRNLFKRDKMTCQYCGVKPGSNELTIDHVIPKSQGGESSWDNCVLACVDCNGYKADRTPEKAGMNLKVKPRKPRAGTFKWDTKKPIKSWEAFLGTAYWNCDISG